LQLESESLDDIALRHDGVDPALLLVPVGLKDHDAESSGILDYSESRDMLSASEATVVSRGCHVVLLGNGGVGKTTLAQRLVTGRAPDEDVGVTHGVLQREPAMIMMSQQL
jgi:translation initiation factor RLI1